MSKSKSTSSDVEACDSEASEIDRGVNARNLPADVAIDGSIASSPIPESRVAESIEFAEMDSAAKDFAAVLRLRGLFYGRREATEFEPIDAYSLHFVARQREDIVAALRVTPKTRGPLESQQHYPEWLMTHFAHFLSASSRMCVHPELKSRSRLPMELSCFAWKAVIPLGIRIDVSKVRLDAIPFYLRMGYLYLKAPPFDFDRWALRCGLVACPVDPKHPTCFSSLFSGVKDPCELDRSGYREHFTGSYQEFRRFVRAPRPWS